MLKMLCVTYWQLHKCVTRIPVYKQPPHEKSREAGSFRESFPWCLIKTEIRHLRQTQNENDMHYVGFNKAYAPINKAGFHIKAVYCKIPQGDIV